MIVVLLRPRGGPAALAALGLVVTVVMFALPIASDVSVRAGMLAAVGVLVLWTLARPRLGRHFGMAKSCFVQDPDLRFFVLFTLIAFAVALSDPVRYLLYVAFFRVDFSHARLSAAGAAALLPGGGLRP